MGFFKSIFGKSKTNSSFFDDIPTTKLDEIEKKYNKVVRLHYKLLEKIEMDYRVVINMGDEFSPQMDGVIKDCLTDIGIAREFYNYCKERAEYYKEPIETQVPTYPSFKRLAIIYEKRKEYDKALEICQKAIDIGFIKDGTTGQMPGRAARLYKKLNKLS